MKKIVLALNLLLACMALTGCSENEIELYDQPNSINFYYKGISIVFTDKDYLNAKVDSVYLLKVQLQGDFLTENRTFCLKSIEREGYKSLATVEYENPYTYDNLEDVQDDLTIRVMRPENPTDGIDKACGASVVFDVENPAHQFAKGREDKSQFTITVDYKFKPNGWEDWLWGDYSYGKYRFMIDTLGVVYGDIEWGSDETVRTAYEEYLKTHDPILDDKGEPIEFPAE